MSRRKTYFDLILQNSKILNAKSTGNFLVSFFKIIKSILQDSKECQTDSIEMSSIPQIIRNNNIFQNGKF